MDLSRVMQMGYDWHSGLVMVTEMGCDWDYGWGWLKGCDWG